MPYRIAIRDNATGEVREHELNVPWGEGSVWWLTEGNFGCDCNRRLSFIRALGREPTEDEWDNAGCGDTAFSILHAKLPDGTLVPVDAR